MTICQEMKDLIRTIRQKYPNAKFRLTYDKNIRNHQFDDYVQINWQDKSILVCHGSRTQRQFGMAWYVSWVDHTPRKLEDTISIHESPKQVIQRIGRILKTR